MKSNCSFIIKLRTFSKVILIDDVGPGSFYSNLNINPLPIHKKFSNISYNFKGLDYLFLSKSLKKYRNLKHKKTQTNIKLKNILFTFGGVDPYKILYKLRFIIDYLKNSYKISIILGPFYKGFDKFPGCKVFRNPNNIYKIIINNDLVITSFGITLYESLYIGVPVITLNASSYHNFLASSLNYIINIGVIFQNKKLLLKKFLDAFKKVNDFYHSQYHSKKKLYLNTIKENQLHNLNLSQNQNKSSKKNNQNKTITKEIKPQFHKKENINNLSNYSQNKIPFDKAILKLQGAIDRVFNIIDKVLHASFDKCFICSNVPRVIDRQGLINFYHCESCKSIFRNLDYDCKIEYGDSYFTCDYKNQYGKTYLEDRVNIDRVNDLRISNLMKFSCGGNDFRLLEIGCAMGFFLDRARKNFKDVCGVEISRYACDYARNVLGLNVFQGSFMDFPVDKLQYDIICAWYFIEHHRDYFAVFDKISLLLKPGGIFALATPNSFGMTFKADPRSYVRRVPMDHFIEFSPKSISLLFNRIGFKDIFVNSNGVYYDRIKKFFNIDLPDWKFLDRIFSVIFKKLCLGDTFEIFFIKKP